MLNRIILMGRLVTDPELKTTSNGVAVASFRLAVDRDFKNKDGEKDADFVPITAWRNTAEFVSKYFTKGRMAVVEGRLQITGYTDKDGVKRTKAEVVAEHVYFGDAKPSTGNGNGGGECASPTDYGAPSFEAGYQDTQDDGEIPF